MSPTIKDVAKHAGVSVATVSRYLNNSPLIAPASVEKVKASIEELHYECNFIAKSLSKQKSLNIAFVVDGSDVETVGNDNFLRIQHGAEQKLSEAGYFILVISVNGNKTGNQLIEKLVKEKRIDGLIIPAALASEELISILQELEIPFVVFGRSKNKSVYSLDLDNVMGGMLATEKLIQSNRIKIGFVTNSFEKVFVQERYEGYMAALKAANIGVPENEIIDGCYDNQDGYQFIIDRDFLCDAYIVTDNMVAFGMLKALEERKIKVPQEVQLVSFDNTVITKVSAPPMTVVDIDVTELGRKAATMLLEQIDHVKKAKTQCLIPVTLIERGTTI